ncbi:MAG TPA: TonB-dependent receptor [Saprospiraceae bacterium]|nr:TonB-dependent receptor [Saprospiraceae bacterium]
MRISSLFALFLLASCQVFAQNEWTADSLILLDETVVTAYRGESKSLRTLEAVAILKNREIQKVQSRTSPEALSVLPGVFVQKTNHGGGSPFLRGLTGNQTLLLIDGVRLNNATFRYGPNQYFNTIDVFTLDRIEALRGGGAVPFGSDAMGGTLQAFTRALEFDNQISWNGKMTARWATQQMEQTLRPEIGFSSKRVAMVGGVSWRKFGDLAGGDTTGRQSPSGYRELDMDIKVKCALNSKATLTVLHQRVHQQNVPVYHKIVLENFAENHMDPQNRALSYVRWDQKLSKGTLKQISTTLSLHETEEVRKIRKNGSSVLRTESDRVKSFGGVVQFYHEIGDCWTIRSGIDGYLDQVNSNRNDLDEVTGVLTPKRGLYPDGSTMSSVSLFSIHSLSVRKWEFTAGGRWNTYSIGVKEADLGEVTLTPKAIVWNGSAGYHIKNQSTIFASAQTSFRTPNIDDLGTLGVVDFRFEAPNYQLKPERSTHFQMGYKWQSSSIQGAAYLYRNELRDLITRVKQDTQMMQGYPLYQKENSGRAYIQGFEADGKYLINQRWSLAGSLTYTYGQNVSDNEPVRRIPPAFGRVALEFKPEFGQITAEWIGAAKQTRLAKGDQDDNRIPKGGTPGWQLLNLHFEYEWKPAILVQVSMLNIFNQDYRTHGSGINGYGRSLFATLQLNIGK